MQGEVQLIVRKTETLTLNSSSDSFLYGSVGSWRIIIPSFARENELVNRTVTLVNSLNETQTCTILSIVQNSPSAGLTRLNFDNTNPFNYDFRLFNGGYFLYDLDTEFYLDLFENESISQNWKFQDLTNFTSQGAFTREFRMPYSQNNQDALGALFDVNVSSGTNNYFHYKLPAEIRVDTLPISSGYLRVRKVYRQQNRINEVEVAFYAETPDLVRNIGEKKLKDITDLPNLNQDMIYANVTPGTLPGIWTLLERGQLWSANGEANTRPLDDNTRPVYASDLTPALSWGYLFEQIFADAGFELVAGTLLGTISDYYMPWLNSKRPVASDSFNELFFRAETSTPFIIYPGAAVVFPGDVEVYDNANDYDPVTYTYTTPASGYYTFQAVLQLTPYSSYGDEVGIGAGVIVDGVNILNLDTVTVLQNAPNTSERILTFRIGIDGGSNVQLVLTVNSNNVLNIFDVMGSWSLIGVELHYGQTFYFDLNAPDAKQIDFVTDVIKMHNCAIVPDRTIPNRIYIVPQNSYLGSGNVIDWTSKLDTSKDITLTSTTDLQKAKFQFTYSEGQDYISKQYKNVNRIYGDYEAVGYTINPNTTPSDFAIGDQQIKLVTQSTPCGVVNGMDVVMPQFLNENGEFVAPGMRCLYYADTTDVQLYNDGTNTVAPFAARLLNHYSVINPDISDFDLNWAPEIPPYAINTNPYNNLFNQWWRTYMNALYSPDARIMEASFALDLKDILTFQFSDKVWIQDSFWRILEVTDYKIGNYESTRVKLLKFLEDTEDCTATPQSVSVNGEVNFVDGNGDPVAASEDCCTRYGYTWDEASAICWAFISNGERRTAGIGGTATSPAPRITKTQRETRGFTNSTISGVGIDITTGNQNMLAVGQDLTLSKAVFGSNLLGKNVTTNLPGMHLGGGYRAGDPTNTETGWSQSGVVHLHNKDGFISAGTKKALFIEGITNEHLEIPDSTTMSCMLNLTIQDEMQNDIDIALMSFGLTKVAGIAYATPVTVISNDTFGTGFTYDITINTVINTAQHRIILTINAAPAFPITLIATATLYYQQNKLT